MEVLKRDPRILLGSLAVPELPGLEEQIKENLNADRTDKRLPGKFDVISTLLLEFAESKGLKFNEKADLSWLAQRDPKNTGNAIFLTIKGSSSWHKDEGIGWLLNWLIYFDRDSFSGLSGLVFPTLITEDYGTSAVEILSNDIFLFDSRKNHVWISNWNCAIIQIPVKPFYQK